MRASRLRAIVLLGFGIAAVAAAQERFESFEDPELQERYRTLIHEVRCLTCQNRSIAESETPLAHDLRREIRERMAAGQTDEEIKAFLQSRYGNFALYKPPLDATTVLLWSAPFLLLLIGAGVFMRIVKVRMNQPIDDDEEVLDA